MPAPKKNEDLDRALIELMKLSRSRDVTGDFKKEASAGLSSSDIRLVLQAERKTTDIEPKRAPRAQRKKWHIFLRAKLKEKGYLGKALQDKIDEYVAKDELCQVLGNRLGRLVRDHYVTRSGKSSMRRGLDAKSAVFFHPNPPMIYKFKETTPEDATNKRIHGVIQRARVEDIKVLSADHHEPRVTLISPFFSVLPKGGKELLKELSVGGDLSAALWCRIDLWEVRWIALRASELIELERQLDELLKREDVKVVFHETEPLGDIELTRNRESDRRAGSTEYCYPKSSDLTDNGQCYYAEVVQKALQYRKSAGTVDVVNQILHFIPPFPAIVIEPPDIMAAQRFYYEGEP